MPQIALGGVRPVTATSALAGINNISASGRVPPIQRIPVAEPYGIAFLIARIDALESRVAAMEKQRETEAIIAVVPVPRRRTVLARILDWFRM